MGQHLQDGPLQLEPPVDFIPMEPRDAPPEVRPEGEPGVEEAQVDDEPQDEDEREHSIASDPGMDADVGMASIADSLPIAVKTDAPGLQSQNNISRAARRG